MSRVRSVFLLVLAATAGCAPQASAPAPEATVGGESSAPLLIAVDTSVPRADISIEGRPARGPDDALVTIVAFTDFQCSFCARAVPTLERLLEAHPDLRLVIRNMPLPMHPDAVPAAAAALEAYAQGGDEAYFRMHDLLFENQRALSREDLVGYATTLGLDVARFERALDEKTHHGTLAEDVQAATNLGVSGTPTFFVNGRGVAGALPYEVFEALVAEERAVAEGLLAQGLPRARVYEAIRLAAKHHRFTEESDPGEEPEPEPEPDFYDVAVPDDAPSRGPEDAPVVIQIVSDFECPFCSRVLPTLEAIGERYEDSVRFVFRHFPLPFHTNAKLAAEAAHEVYLQRGDEAFFAYHDLLFANQRTLDRAKLEELASQVGRISMPRFRRALDRRTHSAVIDAEIAALSAIGPRLGTPSFFINGAFVAGAQPLEVFEAAVERALEEAGATEAVAAED